jgi:hypothetical protein
MNRILIAAAVVVGTLAHAEANCTDANAHPRGRLTTRRRQFGTR